MIVLPENWSDWTIVGEIGRGSFSVVYEAERKEDPSIRCAVKLITIPQDDSEIDELVAEGFSTELSRSFFDEAVADFTREIRVMEQFKGMQNIVSIEDYKVVPKEDGIGSYIFIRMELLSSLEKYISDKTLSEEEIIRIGTDICTALEFCRARRIIHRDIKPANIFVNDRLGTHVFFKLGDFGIARNLEGKTHGLSSRGTPNYMAPEVAVNLPYDTRADIYSLGLTLYWLLNGRRLPFFPQTQLYSPAAKREALQRRLAGEPLEPPVNCSPELAKVILRACSFSPEDRYQTAEELKADLAALLSAGGKTPAENERSGQDPEPRTGKRRYRAAAAAAAALLLAGGVLLAVQQGKNGPASFTEVPAETADAQTPAAAAETETPARETTPDPAENNQITGVFRKIDGKQDEIRQWAEMDREGCLVIPAEWERIPFVPETGSAPTAAAALREGKLSVFFDDADSHGRTVSVIVGGETLTCARNPEKSCYECDFPDSENLGAILIRAAYIQGRTAVSFSYERSDGNPEESLPLNCISAEVTIDDGERRLSAETTLEGMNTYTAAVKEDLATAYYFNGKLEQYDDGRTECSYDRDGYIIAGEMSGKGKCPVVMEEDVLRGRESSQRMIMKSMQAALPGFREVDEYCTDSRLYFPKAWSELPGNDISLQNAPELTAKETETGYELTLPETENLWTVNESKHRDVTRNGNTYLVNRSEEGTIWLELNTRKESAIGDTGVLCKAEYAPLADGTCQCISMEYVYYEIASGTSNYSGTMVFPFELQKASAKDTLDFNNRVEWFDFYRNDLLFVNGSGKSVNLQTIGSYVRSFGQDTLLAETLVREMENTSEQNWLLRPKAVIDRSVPCVELREDLIRRIERTMDAERDSSAYAYTQLREEGLLAAGETCELSECCAVAGDWKAAKVRNASDHTLAVADVTANKAGPDRAWCIPGIILPGESAWIVTEGDAETGLYFVKDDTLQPHRLQAEWVETDTEKAVRITNPGEDSLYAIDWIWFGPDGEEEPTAVWLNAERRTNADYMIPAGQTITLRAEEGGGTVEAWGYTRE